MLSRSRGLPLAFIPEPFFVAVSITGLKCDLMCPTCRGTYLRGMISAESPDRLRVLIGELRRRGVRGFLVSGGFNKEGYLPISREHLRVISEFKNDGDVVFSIHLGLAPKHLVELVWESGVDYVDFEVPPSNKYLKLVKGLNHSVGDYLNLISFISDRYGKDFIAPHVILDSYTATEEEEIDVVRKVAEITSEIFVALIEVRGSWIRGRTNFRRVLRGLRLARELYKEVALGCMRPLDFKLREGRILMSGLIDRVANPRPELVRELNLRVMRACCSLPRRYFKLFDLSSEGLSS